MSGEFVDSNVLVYAHDPTDPAKHARARSLIENLWESRTGRISVQVLQEFYWITTRKLPSPLSSQAAREILADLALWPVYSPGSADVIAAAELAEDQKISFWDALIVTAAWQSGAECVWTEDLNDGQVIAGVTVRNPFKIKKATPSQEELKTDEEAKGNAAPRS